MPDRIPCLVPFCRRTAPADRYPPGYQIICGPHWRAVPRPMKAVYRRARAAERRAAAVDAASYTGLVAVPEHWRLPEDDPRVVERLRAAWEHARAIGRARRLWSACRRRAIEAAGGIG